MNPTRHESRIARATADEFEELTTVWEASVRATHHFLREEDILFYKPLIRHEYLRAVNLYCLKEANRITGFLGTSADKIEMLFIHPAFRGQGVGGALLRYAVETLGLRKVDVNEQNAQAVGFYTHEGFHVVGRAERDGMGKPYPILSLEKRPQPPSPS